jgi:hypothetical protein
MSDDKEPPSYQEQILYKKVFDHIKWMVTIVTSIVGLLVTVGAIFVFTETRSMIVENVSKKYLSEGVKKEIIDILYQKVKDENDVKINDYLSDIQKSLIEIDTGKENLANIFKYYNVYAEGIKSELKRIIAVLREEKGK